MPRSRLTQRLAAARDQREATHATRVRREIQARTGTQVVVDGLQLTSFCGNDYLGLSQHLDVVSALQEAAAWHGVGSTGSAGVSGHHAEHAAFEREMAQWLGYERGLFFGSGYLCLCSLQECGQFVIHCSNLRQFVGTKCSALTSSFNDAVN
jgi:8-amino-7-oxononanoate synthase